MNRSTLLWAWSALVIAGAVAVSACQAIAGLGTRNADPLNNVGGCQLPTGGTTFIRFANLVPSATNADLCVRAHGTSDWGRPILRNSGTDATCLAGFPYKSVSVPIAVSGGALDIQAVPAGGTCAQAATSHVENVTVGASVVTIVRVGGGTAKVPEQLVAHTEDTTANDTSNLDLRVINAIPGDPDINIGVAATQYVVNGAAALPADIGGAPSLPAPVPFGGVEPAGGTVGLGGQQVDANGYFPTLNAGLQLLVVQQGSTSGIIAINQPAGSFNETLYAIGDPQDQTFPVLGLVCDDFTPDGTNPLGDSCTETALPTLSFDTFNVGLYGANSPNEQIRRPDINNAIAKEDADFLCLVETGETETQTDFAKALASAGYVAVYNPTAGLSTQPTDPTNQGGQTPPTELPNAPCVPPGNLPSTITPAQYTATYQAAYSCVVNNCSTTLGDATGTLAGTTSCIVNKCAVPFLALINNYPVYGACYDCLIVNITSDAVSFSDENTTCTTDTRYPMANNGQNAEMLASRYPFAKKADGTPDVDVVWQPTTFYRRAVLSARVQIDPTNAANTLDVYCGFATSPLINSSLDYIGNYSTGHIYSDETSSSKTNGFRDEQNFQMQRLVSYVQKRSGSSPAVIMGDWHASIHQQQLANVDAGPGAFPESIGDQSEEALGVLNAAFLPAHIVGWNYQCQYCSATNAAPGVPNPYNTSFSASAGGLDFLTSYLYGSAFKVATATSSSSVTDEEITQTATYPDIVGLVPKQPTVPGPLSEYYARRIRVLRPAAAP